MDINKKLDVTNQPITFIYDTDQDKLKNLINTNFTGIVVDMKDEGYLQFGPSFHSVQYINQMTDGDITNTIVGDRTLIREFREKQFTDDPKSLIEYTMLHSFNK